MSRVGGEYLFSMNTGTSASVKNAAPPPARCASRAKAAALAAKAGAKAAASYANRADGSHWAENHARPMSSSSARHARAHTSTLNGS